MSRPVPLPRLLPPCHAEPTRDKDPASVKPPVPTVGQLGELRLLRLLRQIFDHPAPSGGAPAWSWVVDPELEVDNGDDALVWLPQGACVATVDSITEGVDWLRGLTPPEAVGHRAGAVNLSDLAAMGATPVHLLLALELPPDMPSDQVLRGARGLAQVAQRFGCRVSGGDLGFSAGPQRWSVTALGEVSGRPLRRDSARPGDRLWLIGEVGMAAVGLAWLQRTGGLPATGHWAEPFVEAHLRPEPLVAAGRLLQRLAVQGQRLACLDISDGLVLDATRLCAASRVGAVVELPAPQWPEAAQQWLEEQHILPSECCGAGGDDYALLVAAAPDIDLSACGLQSPCRVVGQITVGPSGKVFASVGGQVVAGAGWLHGT